MFDNKIKMLLIFLIFLSGLYFYVYYYNNPKMLEGLTNNNQLRCPNLLIQKGSKYYLYNSNIAEVPGVNPVQFNDLEEYTQFLEWQRGAGIRCPVLYLQNTYDAQGNRVYKVRPSVSELQGGLPPTTSIPLPMKLPQTLEPNQSSYDISPANKNRVTPLDMVKQSNYNMLYSDNPMDPNWGGPEYTQSLVDSGYYKGNEVNIRIS